MAGQYFFKVDDNFLPLSGGTVSGNTYVSANLSADTLSLVNTPNNDDSLTQILARNSANGDVEYRDVQSIISAATSQDTYVTGGTYNDVSNELSLERNDAVNIIISGFSSGAQFGTTYFVAPEGSDSTGEYGNISRPFKTITGARNQLLIDSLSGQTFIYVFPGTYDETELQYPNGKMYLSPGSLIKPSAKIEGAGAAMTAVNQGTKTFTFNGNWSIYLSVGKKFRVAGGANDGTYTIVSATDVGGTTEVVVSEVIPSASVGGKLRTNETVFTLGSTPLNAPSGSTSNNFELYGEGDIDIVKSLDDDWSGGIVTAFGSAEFYGEAVTWRQEKGVLMGGYEDSKMTFNGSTLELYGNSGYVTTARDSSDTTFNFDRIISNGSFTFLIRYGSNPTFNGSCVVTSNVIKAIGSSQAIGLQRMGPGGRVVINSPIVESDSFTLNAAQNSGGELILNGNIVASTPSGSGIVTGLDFGNEAKFTINGNITTDSGRAFWGVGTVNSSWYLNGNIESISGSADPILDLGAGSGSVNLNGSIKNTDGGTVLNGISTGGVSIVVENLEVTADNETITSSSPQTVEVLHSLSINKPLNSNITTTGLYNYTGTTNVGDLVIYNTPTNDDSLTQILGRNSTTGNVEYRDVQSIISAATSQDTFVTGFTYDGSNKFTISDNSGSTFSTTINTVTGLTSNGNIEAVGNLIATGGTGNVLTKQVYLENNLGLDWDFPSSSVVLGNNSDGTIINGTSLTINSDTLVNGNVTGNSLNLSSINNDDSLTEILARNSSGLVEYRDVDSIIGAASADTYVVSGNADVATSQLTLTYNTGGTFTVTNSAALFADNDINVTGGTYNPSTGCVTFSTNSGTTFDVCGFVTGITDSYTTGSTLVGESIQFDNNILGSNYYSVSLTPALSGKNDVSTFESYTANTKVEIDSKLNISTFNNYTANTTDFFLTGGTYSSGTATFENNNGDSFDVSGFTEPFTGNTSGDCIDELWVKNISGCTSEDLHIGVQSGKDIYFDSTGTTDSPSLYINSRGQIGVGTNTPFSWASTDGTGIEIHNDSINNQIPFAVTETGTRRFFIETDFATTSNPVHIKGSSSTNLMTFYTSSSSSRVGIGTTVPEGSLQIAKSGTVSDQTKYPSETNIVINNTSNGYSGSTGAANSAAFRFDHETSEIPGGLITSKRRDTWASGEKSTSFEIWNNSGETLIKRLEILPDGKTTIIGSLNIDTILSGTPVINLGIDSSGNVVTGITSLEDVTRVQPGVNINTGGTANNPIVNLDDDILLNSVSATTLSGGTLYSGSTDLSDIFITTADGNDITRVQNGINTFTGGTENNPTINVTALTIDNITVSGDSSFDSVSATTIYSGSTDLSDIFATKGEDSFSTGGTVTQKATSASTEVVIQIDGNNDFSSYNITGVTDTFVSGFNYSANTFTISQNDGNSFDAEVDTIDLSSVLSAVTFDIGTTGSISATTFYSGSTDLSDIFLTTADGNYITRVSGGVNISTGGTANNPIVNLDDDISLSSVSTTTLSGGTLYSGSTDLSDIFLTTADGNDITRVSGGVNTFTGGTENNPTVNVTGLTVDNISVSGISSFQSVSATTYFGDGSNLSGINDFYLTGQTFNNLNYILTSSLNDGSVLNTDLSVLASDIFVVSGVYSPSTGIVTYTNSSGGTFNVSGFTTGMTDSYTNAANINGNVIEFDNNIQGSNFYNVDLSPVLSAFTTGNTYVTGFTYDNANKFTISRNDGVDLNTSINIMTGLTVNGDITVTGTSNLNAVTATTIDFDLNYTGETAEGRLSWNFEDATLDLGMGGGNVTQQIGQEIYYIVKNQSGATISNGRVVRNAGSFGASGRVLGEYMIADGTYPFAKTLGIATEDILNGEDGLVTEFGVVRGIDTTGSLYGESWSDGDVLYVSPTIPGGLTSVEPSAPNQVLEMGVILNAAVNGSIFVDRHLSTKLGDISDIQTTGATNGDLIVYNSATTVWDYSKTLTGRYNINGDLDVTGDTTLGPLTATSVTSNSAINVFNGHVNLRDNSYFLQGRTVADVNVSLIGVDNQDRVFVGNAGYDTYINSDTIVDGVLSAQTTFLTTTPTLNNSATDILVRNSSTGEVEYRPVSGITPDTNTFVSGGTYNDTTNNINFSGNSAETTFDVDLSSLVSSVSANTFVISGTYVDSTDTLALLRNDGNFVNVTGITDTFTTGSTYDNGTALATFNRNDGNSYTLDLSTIDVNDTFITGFTYNDANTFTISRNDGVDITTSFNVVSGLTVNDILSATTLDANTILSGGTNLYDIFLTTNDGNDITRVQPGTNINTGGTANNPVVNLDDDISLNSVSGNTLSGGTIYSGSTDLYNIFATTGSSGEANTASNLGAGEGLFAQKNGVDLQFKSLTSTGTSLSISSDASTVNLERNNLVSVTSITSSSYSAITSDEIIGLDTTSLSPTLFLPDSTAAGKVRFEIKDIGVNARTNPITVQAVGSDTIITTSVVSSTQIFVDGGSIILVSTGSGQWWQM